MAAFVCILATAACTNDDPSPRMGETTVTASQKNEASEVRHDLDPLTRRFPILGTPSSASWVSGTLGNDRMPGPATYWIDAVVQLPPEKISALIAQYGTEGDAQPVVHEKLKELVPQGPWLTSDGLNNAPRPAAKWDLDCLLLHIRSRVGSSFVRHRTNGLMR